MIAVSKSIMVGFLSCIDASMNMWSQRGFSHGTKTPTHAQQSQARPQAKNSKSAILETSQKGREGESSELQQKCQQVICQIDAIATTPLPVKLLTTEQEVKEGEAKSLVMTDPVTPMPLGPISYIWWWSSGACDWLNEWGAGPNQPQEP